VCWLNAGYCCGRAKANALRAAYAASPRARLGDNLLLPVIDPMCIPRPAMIALGQAADCWSTLPFPEEAKFRRSCLCREISARYFPIWRWPPRQNDVQLRDDHPAMWTRSFSEAQAEGMRALTARLPWTQCPTICRDTGHQL